jgi:chitinase
VNKTGGCPSNNQPDYVTASTCALYTAVDNQTAFLEVADTYGLESDWVDFDAYATPQTTCTYTAGEQPETGPCPANSISKWHLPVLYSNLTVEDPSATISNSLANYQNISDWMNDVVIDMSIQIFMANDADAVDAVSTVVYTVDAAVASMQQVLTVAAQVEAAEAAEAKAKREELILLFVSAFLLVIPGLGEELDTILDVSVFARMATLIGDVGDAAMTLYSVYEEPSSAPLAIATALIGGIASRDDSVWADAAKLRRAMTVDDVAALGTRAEINLNKVASLRNTCSI